MVPSERLLSILEQPFCYDYLSGIEETLQLLPPRNANQRVAVYVVRRTCIQLCSFIESIEPTVKRHAAIEHYILKPLVPIVKLLAEFRDVSSEQLEALIQASEAARIKT
jgi:hypothetical protein